MRATRQESTTRIRRIRVAIIDDDADLRFLLSASLREWGMEVVGAVGNGLLGIELVGETNPDVVLLDLAMPVMDGLTALPQIRGIDPAARVIVLSGFGADAMAEEILELGAVAFIEKGITLRRIAEFIEQAVQEPSPDGPPSPVLRLVPDLAS